jgi:hypothetical protein
MSRCAVKQEGREVVSESGMRQEERWGLGGRADGWHVQVSRSTARRSARPTKGLARFTSAQARTVASKHIRPGEASAKQPTRPHIRGAADPCSCRGRHPRSPVCCPSCYPCPESGAGRTFFGHTSVSR